MSDEMRLQVSLLALRIGVFVVMLFWALDKFVQPEHSAAVFENFYLLEGMGSTVLAVIGAVQILIYLAFLAGVLKTWTYGLVLAMHAVSTLSSWEMYLAAFDNLLFFAAWPMLAACLALFLLRDRDRLWTIGA